jgi:hypothetical protein
MTSPRARARSTVDARVCRDCACSLEELPGNTLDTSLRAHRVLERACPDSQHRVHNILMPLLRTDAEAADASMVSIDEEHHDGVMMVIFYLFLQKQKIVKKRERRMGI